MLLFILRSWPTIKHGSTRSHYLVVFLKQLSQTFGKSMLSLWKGAKFIWPHHLSRKNITQQPPITTTKATHPHHSSAPWWLACPTLRIPAYIKISVFKTLPFSLKFSVSEKDVWSHSFIAQQSINDSQTCHFPLWIFFKQKEKMEHVLNYFRHGNQHKWQSHNEKLEHCSNSYT